MKLSLVSLLFLTACASHSAEKAGLASGAAQPDSNSAAELVPPGYGSLRQDDIAVRLEPPGLIVRALPLDEGIIRLLTPDSYRAMSDLRSSHAGRLRDVVRRSGDRRIELWYVSLYGLQPETRFTPTELVITSSGRDFRPIEVIPLTSGFSEHSLGQRETQSALYVFDDEVDLNQPIIITFQSEHSDSWERTLRLIERERVLVKARASGTR